MTSPEVCLQTFTTHLGYHHRANAFAISKTELFRLEGIEGLLSESTSRVTVPSLSTRSQDKETTSSANNPVQAMNTKITVERSSVGSLPRALLDNIVFSFGNLVETRLNQFMRLLEARTKQKMLKAAERDDPSTHQNRRAAALLVSTEDSPTAAFAHTESIFRTLPLSKGFVKRDGSNRIVIIPFILTVKIFTEILCVKTVQVRLTAPGTIVGTFLSLGDKIDHAEVQVDAERLYRCMKMRCDQVVKKSFETAKALTRDASGLKKEPKELP